MLNLIKRNTPEIADMFLLELTDKKDGLSYCAFESENGKIKISADTKVNLAKGYYTYLKKYCGVNLAHCGNTELNVTSAPLPDEKYFQTIEQEKVVYFNYCTFGYSMRSWQWDKWEKEIDFMAMNGVNMPLTVVGYEAVMFYTLLDFGFSEKQALEFIAGPSYYPWQMMTNLDSFMHIPDKAFIDKRLELGRKIIQRELELGMTPIQQGFAGHIPEMLNEKFKRKSSLQHLPMWCGFPGTCQLDPLDSNFSLFGTALLQKQKELFGAYHYYACDPFHENEPPVDGDKYLNDVGRTISKMYTDFDGESTWVMQGWSLREQIVKAVNKDKLLILDLDGSKSELMNGFWGYSFVNGTLHNFGDRNSLHGSVKLLSDNQYAIKKEKYSSCVGTGLFMEGFFQNPLYYDLAFEMLTQKSAINLENWLCDYALRRYGSDEKCLKDAVMLLRKSCYGEKCIGRETSSIVCARPSTTHYHTAPNDVVELRYDNEDLLSALKLLLQSKKACKDGWHFDLCDILRQYMSNSAKEIYFEIMDSFKQKNEAEFKEKTGKFLTLLSQIDRLLLTRDELTFDSHISEAVKNSCCKEHEEIFRKNEVALHTIWGPYENIELFDYAWKEWANLIKNYYLPRWEMFFSELWNSFNTDGTHISDTEFNHNERNDYDTTDFQKKLRDFEFSFIENYKESEKSNEKTEDVVREIVSLI